jgi:ATP-binding cassette subfamily B protein
MGKVTVRAVTPGTLDEDPYSQEPTDNKSRVRAAGLRPGTVKRIVPYLKPHRWTFVVLVVAGLLNALAVAASPVLLGLMIDKGITPKRMNVIVAVALAVVALAALESLSQYLRARCSARIGQGLIYQLRTEVFGHVQQQSIAFFTRSQTGSLVSRLNTDVMGAQQAATQVLSQAVSTVLTLILVLGAMFYLSWQLSVAALVVIPLFSFPGRLFGGRLQRLAREMMQLTAEMGSMMNERFNVGGAMLAKLYGRPREEAGDFSRRAARVRDIGIRTATTGQALGVAMGMAAGVTLALMFGIGGALIVHGAFQVGTLMAMVVLVGRLQEPMEQLSSMQANAMTAVVSFERVFEVLDLKPLVADRPGASLLHLPAKGSGSAPDIEFRAVSFRYPNAREVSLASLESVTRPAREANDDALILDNLDFRAPGGTLTALVGPSGAGKTTITHLVPRLYDASSGAVLINGQNVRDVTMKSLRDAIGVVTQDSHMFHETIRSNLLYARPGASEGEIIEACEAARIWDMIRALPNGLDTVVGDRGYRLSGGEKQRVALARLLLKAPPIVVLDEATAHLDSESEAAIQRALGTALAGRTSLVIAHRLSTIRHADQILVIDAGRVRQRGTHEELLIEGGLYADLYRTQFATQESSNGGPLAEPAVSMD